MIEIKRAKSTEVGSCSACSTATYQVKVITLKSEYGQSATGDSPLRSLLQGHAEEADVSRPTLTSELLHLIEDATFESDTSGLPVKDLVHLTEKSETTVRKAVKELEAGGFIAKATDVDADRGKPGHYVAVTKYDITETPRGGDNMPTKTKTPAEDAPVKRGAGRPKDPAVQERDGRVLKVITDTGGATVTDITAKLQEEKSLVYISIWRLRVAGAIVKTASGTRAPLWTAA